MVFEPESSLKRKMAKNGSVLQYMHSVAGAGKGLIAMGIMLIGIGAMLTAALFNMMGAERAMVMALVIMAPSVLLIVLGIFMQKKREREWVSSYMKKTDMKEQDLRQIDQEFKQPGIVLLSLDNGKDANSLKKMGFITSHYLKFPGPNQALFPLQNMVACFYTKKYLCQDGGYDRALVAYTDDGDLGVLYKDPPEKACLEMIDAIAAHNPLIITDHHFSYEGREYDAVRQPEEVISLHRRMRSGQ